MAKAKRRVVGTWCYSMRLWVSSLVDGRREAWHDHIREQLTELVASGAPHESVRHKLDGLLNLVG
jgi:hypothetical protein